MDTAGRLRKLTDFQSRLASAVTADDLVAAAGLLAEVGISVGLKPDSLCVGARRLVSPIPQLELVAEPPLTARALCCAVRIDPPFAVSGDVHQQRWHVLVAGPELPDPFGPRIAVRPHHVGCWDLVPELLGRPTGPLPNIVAGASPAYDLREFDGHVRRLVVSRRTLRTDLVPSVHPDAQALLAAMAARHPAWHAGWDVSPARDMVVVYADPQPVAGAVLSLLDPSTAIASRFCAANGGNSTDPGCALLDGLTALALESGCTRLRLDDSVFLLETRVPYLEHGFSGGPPYAGDADAPVWAERPITRWQAPSAD